MNTENEARSRDRYRRSTLSSLASLVARLAQVASTVIIVRATLPYLGAERYGLYANLFALVAALGVADLGLGFGLITALAGAAGRDDRPSAQRFVSSAWFLVLAAAAVFGLLAWPLVQWVDWAGVFKVQEAAAVAEARPAVAAFALVFLLSIPLSLVQKIHLGFQEGYLGALFQGAGSLLAMAGTLWAIGAHAPLPVLVAAGLLGPALTSLLNSLYLFLLQRRWLFPRPSLVTRAALSELFRLGALFLVIQVTVAIAFTSDNLVITHVLGLDSVPQLAVQAQPFAWITGFTNVLFLPLWPAFGDALARRELGWVSLTLRRMVWTTLAVTLLPGAVLVLLGPQLMHLWVGESFTSDRWLLGGLALLTAATSLGTALSVLLNAAGVVKVQIITSVSMCLCVLAAKTVGLRLFGLPGLSWGTFAAYGLASLLPTVLYVRAWLKRLAAATPGLERASAGPAGGS